MIGEELEELLSAVKMLSTSRHKQSIFLFRFNQPDNLEKYEKE